MGTQRVAVGAVALALAAITGAAAFPATSVGAGVVTAEAGGPYKVREGSTQTVTGSGTSTDLSDTLTFAWSPADRFADPNTASTTVNGADDNVTQARLTVSNGLGSSDDDLAKVTTINVKPVMPDILVDAVAGPTTELVLTAHATDPGLLDTHSGTVSWGDGTTSPASVVQGAGVADFVASHSYAAGGIYTLLLTITDDDGGTAKWTQPLAVGCNVVGTEGDDNLVGTPGNDVICGLGGNDVITGGAGDDDIYGGDGDDEIYGGWGRDSMYGNAGTDLTSGQQDPDACHAAEIRLNCRLSWWRVPT